MNAPFTIIDDDPAEKVQARVEGLRALSQMDQSMMLDAARSAYDLERVKRDQAKHRIAEIDAKIRALSVERDEYLAARDDAQAKLTRALEIKTVLEGELA